MTPPRTQYGATLGKPENRKPFKYGGFANTCKTPQRSPFTRTGLSVEPLLEEGVSVIVPADHALGSSTLIASRDLSSETLLLPEAPESGCAYRIQFERQLWAAGVVPPEKIEFQSIEAIKQCVAAGMGVSILPSVAVNVELGNGKLAALQWGEPFEVRTQMVWHEERWKSTALRAFLETAREVFSVAPIPIS